MFNIERMRPILNKFIFLLILFIPTFLYAEDICFTEDIAKSLAMKVGQCLVTEEEVILLTQGNSILERTIAAQDKLIEIQKQSLVEARSAADGYRQLIDKQKEVYELILKNNKPSVFDNILKILIGVGLGSLLGLL